jgi:hypothetical protein
MGECHMLPYELERAERINENVARMRVSGLLNAVDEYRALTSAPPPQRKRRAAQHGPVIPRASLSRRCKAQATVNSPVQVIDPGAADPSYDPDASGEEDEDDDEELPVPEEERLGAPMQPDEEGVLGWSNLLKSLDV